jgi:hypothetical protein
MQAPKANVFMLEGLKYDDYVAVLPSSYTGCTGASLLYNYVNTDWTLSLTTYALNTTGNYKVCVSLHYQIYYGNSTIYLLSRYPI